MIADTVTKPMDSTFMRSVLELGRFRIYDELQRLQQNANKKYGNTWMTSSTSADSKEREKNQCEWFCIHVNHLESALQLHRIKCVASRPFSLQGSGGKRIEPLVSVYGKAHRAAWTPVGSGDDTRQRFGVVDNLQLGLVWILG